MWDVFTILDIPICQEDRFGGIKMTEIKEQLSQLNKMSNKSEALYHKVAFSIGISDSSLGVLYTLLDAEAPCSQYDLCSEWSIPK